MLSQKKSIIHVLCKAQGFDLGNEVKFMGGFPSLWQVHELKGVCGGGGDSYWFTIRCFMSVSEDHDCEWTLVWFIFGPRQSQGCDCGKGVECGWGKVDYGYLAVHSVKKV